jgi:hypothetical protein
MEIAKYLEETFPEMPLTQPQVQFNAFGSGHA